jgi:hypothetical protein
MPHALRADRGCETHLCLVAQGRRANLVVRVLRERPRLPGRLGQFEVAPAELSPRRDASEVRFPCLDLGLRLEIEELDQHLAFRSIG